MAESKSRGREKTPQDMLLPPHLRGPAGAEPKSDAGAGGVVLDTVDRRAEVGSQQPSEAASAPSLPCIKTEGVCALRTTPGARFQCIFAGRGCSYLTKAGDKPTASAPRSPENVPLVTTPHPETGESPRWYLPDGRPVYRDALVKRWEALGRPAIVLNKTVSVVDLPKWLAQDDVPIPPRMKWGTWRLDLAELAQVVDFLAKGGGPVAAPPGNKAAEGGAH